MREQKRLVRSLAILSVFLMSSSLSGQKVDFPDSCVTNWKRVGICTPDIRNIEVAEGGLRIYRKDFSDKAVQNVIAYTDTCFSAVGIESVVIDNTVTDTLEPYFFMNSDAIID